MYILLPTPKEMGTWDKITIEDVGIYGEILMENASWQIVYALRERFKDIQGKNIAVIAGPGNNGGDGFAVARHLHNMGCVVDVFYKKDLSSYKKDAAYHAHLALKMGVNAQKIPDLPMDLGKYDIIIDALLGTGFSGSLRDDYKRIVESINSVRDRSYILSVDIPSGLNGITGEASPIAVMADSTVTFEEAKVGLFLHHAKRYVGELIIGKIGIPREVKEKNPPSFYGIGRDIIKHLPDIKDTDHKGCSSNVLVIGGAKGLSGAATLCSLGALKAGSSLVTAAIPRGCSLALKLNWPEIMFIPLGSREEDEFRESHMDEIKEELSRFDVVVIGPGMGRGEGGLKFLKKYLTTDHPPTIIDADGLFNLSKLDPKEIKLSPDTILTPHPGEMAYLMGTDKDSVQKNRFDFVKKCVEKFGCVCVLKGAGSLVCDIDKKIYISDIACKNLAIGGSGDVLAGIIAHLKGMGLSSRDAACMGVVWHGMAGEYLKKHFPFRGNLAQDIAFSLPEVRCHAW